MKKHNPYKHDKRYKEYPATAYRDTLQMFLNTSGEGEDPYYVDDNFIMSTDREAVLDRDGMKVKKFADYGLSPDEKEIATQLIRDGYLGTFDELLITVRKLANG